MQKKENQGYKDEMEEFKQFLASRETDEEPIDIQQVDFDHNVENIAPNSRLMQNRINQ